MNVNLTFPSLNALADAAARADASEWSHGKQVSFFGRATFDEAVQLARHGWPEGSARARALAFPPPPLVEPFIATTHDVTGSFVDIGAYVDGIPECMIEFTPDKRPARFARIVVSATFAAGISPTEITRRGAAIAAIVDNLESQGIRCDVDAVMYIAPAEGSGLFTVTTSIKRAHDPLNLDTLTFALAHPAFLRRFGFALMEQQSPEFRRRYNVQHDGCYGRVPPMPDVPGAITFDSMRYGDDWSEAATLRRIRATLDTFTKEQST